MDGSRLRSRYVEKSSLNIIVIHLVLDGIQNDPLRSTIEMKLANNNQIRTLPENETDALAQLLGHLVNAPDEISRLQTIRDAKVLLQNNHLSIGQLLRRGMPLITFIVNLRRHQSFSSLPLNPKELATFHLFVWELVEPILNGGMHELVFLSSDVPLPSIAYRSDDLDLTTQEKRKPFLECLRTFVRKRTAEAPPVSESVFDCVVNASEELFVELKMESFDLGSSPDSYADEMDAYADRLESRIMWKINDMKTDPRKDWTPYDERVSAQLSVKLKLIIDSELLRRAGLTPVLPGPLPILCPSLFIFLTRTWLDYLNVLYMVCG